MEEQIRIKSAEIQTENQIQEQQENDRGMQKNLQQVMTARNAQQDPGEQPGGFLAQFTEAAEALQKDTSRSSDSFEMKAVKREMRKLRQLLRTGNSVELAAQYNWMETVLRDKYLTPRQSERSAYRARHQKVEKLLGLISAEKKRLLKSKNVSEADILKVEQRNMSALNERICRSSKEATNNRVALQMLLAKSVPMQEQQFEREKEKLLAAFDALIGSFRKVANSFCMTESAKQNRLDAERVILQLKRDKQLYQEKSFEVFAKHHYRVWGEELVDAVQIPVIQTNRDELTNNKNLFVETDEAGVKADAATKLFFQIVGASKLSSQTGKANLDDGEEGQKEGLVISKGRQFFTHDEAVAYSRETGVNLSYSYEALCQLGTIQIIDMICGQRNRRPDSFVYKLTERRVEGETYLMIESVKVRDNTRSFGTESFAELNRDSEEGEENCTKKLVSDKGILTIPTYDAGVADTIISLDSALIQTYFLNAGLEMKQAKALSARLERMQEALRNDKDHGRRKHGTQAPTQKEKESAHQDFLYESKHFLGVKTLLRDRGTAAEGQMKDINNTEMNQALHSNARSIQKAKQIEDAIHADLQDKFGYQELPEETDRILVLIDKYAKANKNKEWYQSILDEDTIPYLQLLTPALLEEVKQQVEEDQVPGERKTAEIKRRLREKYGNRDEMFNSAEEGPLEELRPKLDARINVLTSREGALSEQEQTELRKLRTYMTGLFGQCDGTLEIPANAGVRYVSDRTGFQKNIPWRKKYKTPLFCHEPRISDLNQGEVGDCYFVATLAAVVNQEPELIKQNMKDNGDGTVTVRFFKPALIGDPKPIYVKVDKSVPGGELSFQYGLNGAMWGKLYEKAFIASGLKKNRWFTRYNPGDIVGGQVEDAALYITGRKTRGLFSDSDGTPYKKYRDPNSRAARRFREHVNRMRTLLQEATDHHQIMMGGTFRTFQVDDREMSEDAHYLRGLQRKHAYTILGLVKIDGKDFVQLRNPGGKGVVDLAVNETTGNTTYRGNQTRAGAFYLDLDTFCRFFGQLYAINSPAT